MKTLRLSLFYLFDLSIYRKALKEIDSRIENNFVEQEISILKKVNHQNIIKYLDFFSGIFRICGINNKYNDKICNIIY